MGIAASTSAPSREDQFLEAVKTLDYPRAQQLIQEGVDVNYIDTKTNRTALSYAIQCEIPGNNVFNKIDRIAFAYDNPGVDFFVGVTAQIRRITMLLLANGANPNLPADSTVLVQLFTQHRYDCYIIKALAEILLRHGADANAGNGKPLDIAIEKHDDETVKLLLDHGANPNGGVQGAQYTHPLYKALLLYARAGCGQRMSCIEQIIDLLMQHGATIPEITWRDRVWNYDVIANIDCKCDELRALRAEAEAQNEKPVEDP